MSFFSVESLNASLYACLPLAHSRRFCVAFSGGLDSTVLLATLADLRATQPDWRLRAIHIDHQLNPASGDWAAHCKRVAAKFGVELTVERVVVPRDHLQGLEAAARFVRYAVFRRELQHGEALLTAHHADDQAETVLLALLRGSGVQGLAAMPAAKAFGKGWHLRPLLGFTRADLSAWASERGIDVIDDPSNAVVRHDRNYLRHEVLPKLRERWPSAANNVGRSASHLGEALGLLESVAMADLATCAVERCLRIESLQALPSDRQRNLLRYWLRLRGLPLPSTRKLAGLLHDIFNTDLDRIPCVRWQGVELHWHRGLLYADVPTEPLPDAYLYERTWEWRDAFELPTQLGRLWMRPITGPGFSAARLPERIVVRFRRGGEKIRLPGRQHRSALRNLLQEGDVLPWWRDRLPYVFAGKQLLAVGDLFVSNEFAADPGEAAVVPVWEGAPEWKAVGGRDS